MKKLLLLSFFLLMSFGVGAANAKPSGSGSCPPGTYDPDGMGMCIPWCDLPGGCFWNGDGVCECPGDDTDSSESETTPEVEQKVISYSPEGVSNVVKNKDNNFSWTFSHKKHRSADTQANATPAD